MKAVVRQRYGPPELLALAEVERPVPGDRDVLVAVRAASLNASDVEALTARPVYVRLVGGGLRRPRWRILGSDVAGRVEAVGREVTRFRPGDEVLADTLHHGLGGLAEYVAVAEEAPMVRKPDGLSFEEAAAIPQAAVIALQGIRPVEAGQRVLINGAGGGAGSFAVQLARAAGAEVTAMDRTGKLEMLRALGADQVADFTREGFALLELAAPGPFDLILDLAAHRSILEYRPLLAPAGVYLMVGGSMASLLRALVLGPLLSRRGGRRMGILGVRPNSQDLATAARMVAEGRLECVIDRRYPLGETAEALRYLAQGRARGKVVITV